MAEIDYQFPDIALLEKQPQHGAQTDEALLDSAAQLAQKLSEFGVAGQIKHICLGPVVTTYEFKPDPGVRYSRIAGLAEDLCLALGAESVRVSRLPGKPHVGIEVSNQGRDDIPLRGLIEARPFKESSLKLTAALGVTTDGMGFVLDLAKLPNLLIAGATGTGKSVCVNSTLPYIVVVIDEIADLVDSGYEIEEPLTRLAQTARSAGIHLAMATQRPSADVIAGIIKAGFPARVSFKVSSKVDSRIVLDGGGAERLLGRGDMLFLSPDNPSPVRVHGAFVGDAEVGRVAQHVRVQGEPVYAIPPDAAGEGFAEGDEGGERDELFEQALRVCVELRRASTSVIQRRLRIGYGRAAAILDAMEQEGFIGRADGERPRPVLSRAYKTVDRWDDDGETRDDTGMLLPTKNPPDTSAPWKERGVEPIAEVIHSPFTRDTHGFTKLERSPIRLPWLVAGIILLIALLLAVYYRAFS